LSNDDLDFGERISAGITGAVMGIPMLASGLKDLKTGFTGLNSVLGLTAAVQKAAALNMLSQASATDLLTGKMTA
jgi:hypothetical protein